MAMAGDYAPLHGKSDGAAEREEAHEKRARGATRRRALATAALVGVALCGGFVWACGAFMDGRPESRVVPAACRAWDNGCERCVREQPGDDLFCSPVKDCDAGLAAPQGCTEWFTPLPSKAGLAPGQAKATDRFADCLRWFDGCNVCSRDRDDLALVSCTERACYDLEEPHCILPLKNDGAATVAKPAPAGLHSSSVPTGCVVWFDGCNTCRITSTGLRMCTRMMCVTKQTPYCKKFDTETTVTAAAKQAAAEDAPKQVVPEESAPERPASKGPPAGCVSWFDGCNTCKVSPESGVPLGCTRMLCHPEMRQEPKCLKFESN